MPHPHRVATGVDTMGQDIDYFQGSLSHQQLDVFYVGNHYGCKVK